jgi:hypothetical protein
MSRKTSLHLFLRMTSSAGGRRSGPASTSKILLPAPSTSNNRKLRLSTGLSSDCSACTCRARETNDVRRTDSNHDRCMRTNDEQIHDLETSLDGFREVALFLIASSSLARKFAGVNNSQHLFKNFIVYFWIAS